jgi:hypothetical protein
MDDETRRDRLRSFALGSLVGASAALAAARKRRPRPKRRTPLGLAAFEDAPCYQELVEQEESASEAPRGRRTDERPAERSAG